MSDTLVIIPTYNEKENIEAIIRKTFEQKKAFDVLVVDVNSPDGTAEIEGFIEGDSDGSSLGAKLTLGRSDGAEDG